MGKEIIVSEFEYHKQLEAIDIDIHKNLDENIFLLLKEKYFDFIHNKLGIRVSGFMVYDSFMDKHILYQNPLIDDKGYFYPQIPYKINKGEYEEIIDLAFFGNRHPGYKNDFNDEPEFHRFFHHKNKIHPLEKQLMHEFWDSEGKPKRNSDVISMFHRPTGEILFFLYAWRYLVRLSSKFDLETIINSFEDFCFTSYSAPKIQQEDWFKLTTGFDFGELFEKFQIDINEKKSNSKTEIEKNILQSIIERTAKAFSEYQKYEYVVTNDTDFTDIEWNTLGINPYHERGRLALRSLIEYAIVIAKHSGDSAKSAQRKKVRGILDDTLKHINNANYDEIKQEDIHNALAYIFYTLFTVEGNTYKDIFEQKYLRTVQFPVFPYFLEIFFDKDELHGSQVRSKWHSPKEHLVFPIWYSKAAIVEEDKQHTSRYVAYVLLSMEPVWSFTDCFECYDDATLHKINILRIKTLFQVINKTLVEKGFYENVVRKQLLKPAAKAAISQVMARNMSHNLGSHVLNKLTGDLSSINIKKYKNYKSNFKNKVFTKAGKDRLDQISKFNNYIKCRMDYLSDITFGIPAMQISKRLKSEILSDLDDVRLLLENISGLSKFEYSIKIQSNIKNESDPVIAIPNDILGSQAFYNIIENIIRNTAKHSDKKTDNTKDNKQSFIEFTIKISELDSSTYPEFSSQFYQIDLFDNVVIDGPKAFDEVTSKIKYKEDTKDEDISMLSNLRYLVYCQNNKLNDSILKDDNTLRSTSLGLIEMEASACYLRKMDISNLESDDYQIEYNEEIKNSKGNLNILKAVAIENKHLGYRFFVLKPTEVLLVGNYELSAGLKNNGFLGLTLEDFQKGLDNGKVYNHQFLLYEVEKVFELLNLPEEVKGLNNTIIEVAKYKALLPKRIMQLPKSEIDFKEKQPKEVLNLLWEKWAGLEKFDKCIIDVAVPKEEKSDKFHLLSHGESDLSDEDKKLFKDWFNSQTNKNYIEALSKEGKSKLPEFGENTKGCDPLQAMSKYYNKINEATNSHLYFPILESAKTKIVLLDERVQYAAFNQKYGSYHYFKYYQHCNIIVPEEGIDLGANDLSDHRNKIEDFVIANITNDNYLVIHYSILERFFNKSNNKELDVHKWLNEFCSKTNVIVTSGRGTLKNLPPAVQFVNLSPLIAAAIDFRSKYYLHQVIMSSRKPNNI